MTLSNFYTTYHGALLKDDGSTVSDDFKKFAEDFRGVLRGICTNNMSNIVLPSYFFLIYILSV